MNTLLHRQPNAILSMARLARPRLFSRETLQTLNELEPWGVSMQGAQLSQKALRQYERVCDMSRQDFIPILYPQVWLSPMQMALFADKTFPVSMIGAVHKRNEIIQTAAMPVAQSYNLSVSFERCRVLKRGVEFVINNRVSDQNGAPCWQSVSTYFIKKKIPEDWPVETEPDLGLKHIAEIEDQRPHRWLLELSKGRDYAKITGDFNPIHISKWAARVFGFKRDLVHGFCLLASTMEKLPETSASQLNNQLLLGARGVRVDVAFKGPNYLGEEIKLFHQRKGLGHRIDLYCGSNNRPTMLVAVKAK